MDLKNCKVLIIDNRDSFTYNLVQLVLDISGRDPLVVLNDAPLPQVLEMVDTVDAVVLSPGPGTPEHPEDFGICRDIIEQREKPILGVCMGLQGLAHCFGGKIKRAAEPVHGRTCTISHNFSTLFKDIPQDFIAVRYNSLVIDPSSLPSCFTVTAWTDEPSGVNEIMAIQHNAKPFFGVQFHPESIASEYGEKLMRNFLEICGVSDRNCESVDDSKGKCTEGFKTYRLSATTREWFDPESFCRENESMIWLDSSLSCRESKLGGRFSYLIEDTRKCQKIIFSLKDRVVHFNGSREHLETRSFFDFFKSVYEKCSVEHEMQLDFPFKGGWVGFFSYEMQNECLLYSKGDGSFFQNVSQFTPDAYFVFADNFTVFDHEKHECFSITLENDAQIVQNTVHLEYTRQSAFETWTKDSRESYTQKVDRCIDFINAGDSYELCLTSKVYAKTSKDPYTLYKSLRNGNPAPYAAFLSDPSLRLYICCSSPERFMKIDCHGTVQCKPIKGTRKRYTDPLKDELGKKDLVTSIKDRAENLMIVDLIRNDLGRVCQRGTVKVPRLMALETYETVHHLVSTVEGVLKMGTSSIECFRNSFPPGSMTGAPKHRSMQILSELEGEARGVYSGCIGYFSLDGACEFNVVIRTAVFGDGVWGIGCGGAVVALSDRNDEYEEMLLKSDRVLRAFEDSVVKV